MKLDVLISGGGVAGLAAAWWLDRAGAHVTVVERAKDYQPQGHFIALKAQGVHLIKQMGLYDACHAHAVQMGHLKIFSRDGDLLRETTSEVVEQNLDGYLLFKRAHLHAELYGAISARGLVQLDTQPGAIADRGTHVEVELKGKTERFDLVIGADGIHSATREKVFGSGFLKPMHGSYLAMNLPGPHGLEPGCVETYFGQGQTVLLIPATADEVTVMIYHGDGGLPMPEAQDQAAMRAFLHDAYADFPEHVRSAFARLGGTSFVYRDTIAQVEMPSIVKGRVALMGDAAHCPTFMSGMGSSLALQGAQAMAQALEQHAPDVPAALAAYEKTIAPAAAEYQKSAQRVRPFLMSRSGVLRAVRDATVKHIPDWVLALETRRFYHAHTQRDLER
jgi:2-polyprenyl-6-methoxyphenol hydroxylase-like FAD-dependent oxidoreductase